MGLQFGIKNKWAWCIYNNTNCDSGIIKADYSQLDLVLTHTHTHYKTYIKLQFSLSNKYLKLLVDIEVASAIPPDKLFQLLITCLLNECFLRSVFDE